MKIIASITPNKTKFAPLYYSENIYTGIKELSELGYDGIELSIRTPQDIEITHLMEALEKADLELVSIATGQSYIEDGLSLFHTEEPIRIKAIERIKQFVDVLSSIGNEATVIIGGIRGNLGEIQRESQYKNGCKAIDKCVEYAQKKGIILLLEAINRYETNLFNNIASVVDFVASRDTEHLLVLADTFHMNIEEQSIKGSLDSFASYIGAIHCADSNRLAPGMGHTQFHEIISNIDKFQNLKYLGIEVLPVPSSKESARTAIETLKTCLKGQRD